MNLTRLITARVSKETHSKIKAEVKSRKGSGQRINQADVIRAALIAYFQNQEVKQA